MSQKRKRQPRKGGRRREQSSTGLEGWVPKTRLGRLVADGKITHIDQALESGLPLREPQIVDTLLPGLVDEVLDINMVQRMTDSGRRVKFRATVVVGNHDGYVGLAAEKDVQVGLAISKSINVAKLNLLKVPMGCGSWECGCGEPHTVPFRVVGRSGSVSVELLPAPRGLGLAAGTAATQVLQKAGIRDVWTRTSGQTRTTINFARATHDALRQISLVKVRPKTKVAEVAQ